MLHFLEYRKWWNKVFSFSLFTMQVSVLDFCSCLAVLFCFQLDSIVEKQHDSRFFLSMHHKQTRLHYCHTTKMLNSIYLLTSSMMTQIIAAMCSKVPLIGNAVMKATGCGTFTTMSFSPLLSLFISSLWWGLISCHSTRACMLTAYAFYYWLCVMKSDRTSALKDIFSGTVGRLYVSCV